MLLPVSPCRAHVLAVSGSGGAAVFVMADSSGHWRFPALACGPVQIVANRPGFLNGPSGVPVLLASGSPAHDIAIRLTPTSVITGRVVDDQGDPVMNSQIILLASRVTDGRRSFVLPVRQAEIPIPTISESSALPALLRANTLSAPKRTREVGATPCGTMLGETCYPGSFESGAATGLDLPAGA